MKRHSIRRFGALLLGLVLMTGVAAKAYGLAICPMHQMAQSEHHGHRGHHHGASDASSVCNCVDACQSGCSSAVLKTGAPRLFLRPAEVSQVTPVVSIHAPRLLQAHVLPFATAPPFLA
jgi:hypothetical protein